MLRLGCCLPQPIKFLAKRLIQHYLTSILNNLSVNILTQSQPQNITPPTPNFWNYKNICEGVNESWFYIG